MIAKQNRNLIEQVHIFHRDHLHGHLHVRVCNQAVCPRPRLRLVHLPEGRVELARLHRHRHVLRDHRHRPRVLLRPQDLQSVSRPQVRGCYSRAQDNREKKETSESKQT